MPILCQNKYWPREGLLLQIIINSVFYLDNSFWELEDYFYLDSIFEQNN